MHVIFFSLLLFIYMHITSLKKLSFFTFTYKILSQRSELSYIYVCIYIVLKKCRNKVVKVMNKNMNKRYFDNNNVIIKMILYMGKIYSLDGFFDKHSCIFSFVNSQFHRFKQCAMFGCILQFILFQG